MAYKLKFKNYYKQRVTTLEKEVEYILFKLRNCL